MKIIAAHYPTYLPRFEFFHKLFVADAFVIADDFQFSKHHLINRARIKAVEGARWLTVPVLTKNLGKQKIHDVQINNGDERWRQRHWRSLEVNYAQTAYFLKYADDIEAIYRQPWTKLLDLNLALIRLICKFLKLEKELYLSSRFQLKSRGAQRIVDLVKELDGSAYFVGKEMNLQSIDRELFEKANVELLPTSIAPPRYYQPFGDFIPDLSILDLLFNEEDSYFYEYVERQS